MKREILKETALIVIGLSLAIIFGCSENTSLNQPDSNSNSAVLKSHLGTMDSAQTWQFLSLPNENELGKKEKGSNGFTVTGLIKADKKSKLQIKEKYDGGPHGEVKVEIKVDFPEQTVAEDTYITMTFDPETGITTFLPHMIFNHKAKVSVKYEGADLSNIDEDALNFLYWNENGEYIPVDKKKYKIKVKKNEGKVEVKDVQDLDFSRYVFAR